MIELYYVKPGAGLTPVPDDSVERFAVLKATPLVAEGKLVAYDEKRHGNKPGAPPYEARKAKEREEREAAEAQRQAAPSARR